jgi:hypothetical protein
MPTAPARAQAPADPGSVAQAFVRYSNESRLGAAEARRLMSGELASFDAASLGGAVPEPDRVVTLPDGSAVARIPAGPRGNPDIYLFIGRSGGAWSVTAIRVLALTGPIHHMGTELDALPSRTAEQEATLRNLRLTLSPDRELIDWSRRHRAVLDQARADPDAPGTRAALEQIGATRAYRQDGRVHVGIGGILDNEVGFLFAADGVPPPIDRSNFIWVEDAGGGWFLYKTT